MTYGDGKFDDTYNDVSRAKAACHTCLARLASIFSTSNDMLTNYMLVSNLTVQMLSSQGPMPAVVQSSRMRPLTMEIVNTLSHLLTFSSVEEKARRMGTQTHSRTNDLFILVCHRLHTCTAS